MCVGMVSEPGTLQKTRLGIGEVVLYRPLPPLTTYCSLWHSGSEYLKILSLGIYIPERVPHVLNQRPLSHLNSTHEYH